MSSITVTRWYVLIGLLATGLKVCLFGLYHSTDFEVHRNWLAVTYQLPLRRWYYDTTSIWTLDYPPFFAFFERALAEVAVRLDGGIVKLSRDALVSDSIVLFQRGSVILTELLLLLATASYLEGTRLIVVTAADGKKDDDVPKTPGAMAIPLSRNSKLLIFAFVAFNPGLLLVDHIHFQYNGFLLGVLVLCLDFAQRKRYVAAAAAFSTLILLKHLFVTLAPLFAVYLVRVHCLPIINNQHGLMFWLGALWRFVQLAVVALTALLVAFAPFVWDMAVAESSSDNRAITVSMLKWAADKQLRQMLTRLLPFGRGLVHTYWAPNMWALYFATDRVLSFSADHFHLIPRLGKGTVSGTLGDVNPDLLPAVSAGTCLLLTLLAMLPALRAVYLRPKAIVLVRAVVYCSLCSFMLGYHVHEKAVIVPLVVQTLLFFSDPGSDATSTGKAKVAGTGAAPLAKYLLFVLTAGGVFGLFPLFTQQPELVVKSGIYSASLALVCLLTFWAPHKRIRQAPGGGKGKGGISGRPLAGFLLIALFAAVHAYNHVLHGHVEAHLGRNLDFLPLLLTSVVSAVVLVYGWVLSLVQLLDGRERCY